MNRRTILRAAVCLALPSMPLRAQQGPIRLLVGFPAGGSTDVIARHLARGMSESLQRTVVVENRPGAGGQIAATALKAAAPDGNTLFLSNSHALAMIPLTVRQPGYDPAMDFAPIGMVGTANDVLAVNPAAVGDVRGVRALVEWANAHPGQGSIGVPAPSSDPDFGVRIIASELKADVTPVPYRGDGPVIQDLIAGQIPAGIASIGATLQYVRSGKLRIIAVSGQNRLASLPDVPTYTEQGIKGYGISGFVAVVARAGMPSELVRRYNGVVTQVVGSTEFKSKLQELGVVSSSSSPDELAARIRDTRTAFADMVRRVGYKIS